MEVIPFAQDQECLHDLNSGVRRKLFDLLGADSCTVIHMRNNRQGTDAIKKQIEPVLPKKIYPHSVNRPIFGTKLAQP